MLTVENGILTQAIDYILKNIMMNSSRYQFISGTTTDSGRGGTVFYDGKAFVLGVSQSSTQNAGRPSVGT